MNRSIAIIKWFHLFHHHSTFSNYEFPKIMNIEIYKNILADIDRYVSLVHPLAMTALFNKAGPQVRCLLII